MLQTVQARQHEDQDLLDSLRPEPGFDSREAKIVKRETEDEFWAPVDTASDMAHYRNTMRSLKSFRESQSHSKEEISNIKLNDFTLNKSDLKLDTSEVKLNGSLKKTDTNYLNLNTDNIRTLGDGAANVTPNIGDLNLNASEIKLKGSTKELHTNDLTLRNNVYKSNLSVEDVSPFGEDGTVDEIQTSLDHTTGDMTNQKLAVRSLKGFGESQSSSKEEIKLNDLALNINDLQSNNALKKTYANDVNFRNVAVKNNLGIRNIRAFGDGTVAEIPDVNSQLSQDAPKNIIGVNNIDIRTLGNRDAEIPSDGKFTHRVRGNSQLVKEEPKHLFKKSTEILKEINNLDIGDIRTFRDGIPEDISDLKSANAEKDNISQLGREVPKNLYQSSENLMEKLKRAALMDKSNVSKAVNHFNKSYLKADKKSRQKKSTYEEVADDSEPGDERKLAMYARSLIYTNKLLNKEFGFQNRKVRAFLFVCDVRDLISTRELSKAGVIMALIIEGRRAMIQYPLER